MDYKEKYEQAVLRMNKWVEGSEITDPKEVAEFVFPELKENEDEKIIKEILSYIKSSSDVTNPNWIAWLEKQGKKIDVIENFDTEFEKQVSHLIASAINKEHEYNQSYVKWTANALLNYAKHELEKQGEQSIYDVPSRNMILAVWELGNEWKELTNGSISKEYGTQLEYIQKHWNESQYYLRDKQGKQKPKFRVGDSIKCKYDDRIFTIKSVDLDKGTYTYTQEGCGNDIDYADEMFELVEQKPADKIEPKFKVGDTIVEKDLDEYDYETIKGIKDGQYIFTDGYCMNIDEQEGWQLVKTPAIIEQKSACQLNNLYGNIKFPFKARVKSSGAIITIHDGQLSMDCKEWINYQSDAEDGHKVYKPDELELVCEVEQNPAWSEEDERNLEGIINEIEANKNNASDYDLATYDRFLSWLKSLKDRVQPQPKQEWSKEDERIFTLCAVSVKTRYNDGLLTHYEYELASLWLESIKERMKGE